MNTDESDEGDIALVSSFQYTQWALRTRLDASCKLVLAVLCDARDWDVDAGTAKLSLSDLSERTGYGRQKVNNCLSFLKMYEMEPLIEAKGSTGGSGAMVYSFPLFDKLAALNPSTDDGKKALKLVLPLIVSNWNAPRLIQQQKAEAHPERKHKQKSSENVVMMKWGKK